MCGGVKTLKSVFSPLFVFTVFYRVAKLTKSIGEFKHIRMHKYIYSLNFAKRIGSSVKPSSAFSMYLCIPSWKGRFVAFTEIPLKAKKKKCREVNLGNTK